MKHNLGSTDRAIRLFLGIVFGVAGLYFQSWWGLVAIVPILTALFSFCPLYSALGINSCKEHSV